MANTALLRLLDIADVADLLGQNLYDYLSFDSYDRYRSGIDQLLSDHQHTLRIEITLQLATKQLIPVEISVGRFSDFDGADLQMIVRDITERKLAEAKIQRHVSQLTSLHAIGVAITASLDLRTTLDVLIERMLEHLGTDAAGVLLINQRTGLLEPAVSRGPRLPLQKQYLLHADEGLPGIACLTRRSVSISRISPENLRCERDRALSEMFASYFAVPLLMGNDVLGVIEIMHQTPFTPDQHWWVFLDALAMQAAIAINTATLFAQLQQANSELTHAYNATIEGWSRALDLRDRETEGHSVRVTELALQLAKRMNLPPEELDHIRRGALLHDIGKMGVPDRILLKPGPLNADEWQVMRQHPIYAYEWLSPIPFLQPALAIPYAHHERWDGSGYPRGLRGEQIPLMARIFAVVDVWDALRSVRPYRLPWSEERVMTHIYALSDSHFDPQVVKAFLDLIQEQAL
jgi:putative nucleotidyltransferase with HDIG domain